MPLSSEEKRFLSRLVEDGVGLILAMPFGAGWRDVNTEEIQELMQDKTAFIAKCLGTTVPNLRAWMERDSDDYRCVATTRSGRRCKIIITERPLGYACPMGGNGGTLPDLSPGIDDHCLIHRGFY